MGEIADMILDGLMSEDGEYIGPEPDENGIVHAPGFPAPAYPSKAAKRRAKRLRRRARDAAGAV